MNTPDIGLYSMIARSRILKGAASPHGSTSVLTRSRVGESFAIQIQAQLKP
jgi:hypothetical protein